MLNVWVVEVCCCDIIIDDLMVVVLVELIDFGFVKFGFIG